MSKDDFPASEFWDFSLATYGRPGVAPGCLSLQDRRGVDVNIAMLCCWIGASGRGHLEAGDLEAILAVAKPWHDAVVVPLRGLRRHLKTRPAPPPEATVEAVRRRIATAELAAEHAEQLMIAAAVARVPDGARTAARRLADAVASLERYVTAIGVVTDAADRADLVALLAGAFPELDRADVEQTVIVTII